MHVYLCHAMIQHIHSSSRQSKLHAFFQWTFSESKLVHWKTTKWWDPHEWRTTSLHLFSNEVTKRRVWMSGFSSCNSFPTFPIFYSIPKEDTIRLATLLDGNPDLKNVGKRRLLLLKFWVIFHLISAGTFGVIFRLWKVSIIKQIKFFSPEKLAKKYWDSYPTSLTSFTSLLWN